MAKRTITSVTVSDVEKRRFPDKHYVYVISVRWSDGTSNIVYRRYSEFFNLQTELIEKFPKESGRDDPEDRIIPFLPGKILFGRSNVRDVAVKRQPSIDEYCQKLVTLPARISECDEVIGFFEVTDDDIRPKLGQERHLTCATITDPLQVEHYVAVADYEKETGHEVRLVAGMAVDVIEKNESGWWLVSVEEEQGWVPSTYLERVDGKEDDNSILNVPGDETSYICTCDYSTTSEDEISLVRGACVVVLNKKLDGWWWISYKDKEGWAPATYLEKLEPTRADHFPSTDVPAMYPVQIVRSLYDVTNLSISQNKDGATSNKSISDAKPKVETVSQDGEDEVEIRPGKEGRINGHKRSSSSSNPRFSHQPPRKTTIDRKKPPKRPDPPKIKKEYFTVADFTDHAEDGISFTAGQSVKMLEKNVSGWWYVEIDGNCGWAPSSYIEEKVTPLTTRVTECKAASVIMPLNFNAANRRKFSRESLGVPPPPPIETKSEESKSNEARRNSSTKDVKEPNNNQTESRLLNLGKNFALPKFTPFKKSDSTLDSSINAQRKSEIKSESKVETRNSVKNGEDLSVSQSVSNLASAFKSVLKSGREKAKLPVQISHPSLDAVGEPAVYEEIPSYYTAVAEYKKTEESELSLMSGQQVLVLEKTDTGWWLVGIDKMEGWVPASFLEETGTGLYEDVTISDQSATVEVVHNKKRAGSMKDSIFSSGDQQKYEKPREVEAPKNEEEKIDYYTTETVTEKRDLRSELSKMMSSRRPASYDDETEQASYEDVWSEDKAQKIVPTEVYDVIIQDVPRISPRQSQIDSTTLSVPTSHCPNTYSDDSTGNAFAEAKRKFKERQTRVNDWKPKNGMKPKPVVDTKPKLIVESKPMPKTVVEKAKPFVVGKPEPIVKPALDAKPKLNPNSVSRFMEKKCERRSSADNEVDELMRVRSRLTTVQTKDDSSIITVRQSPVNLNCKTDTEQNVIGTNTVTESVVTRAKMFSNPGANKETKVTGHDRPRTPSKLDTVSGLRRGSVSGSDSPAGSRPSTPPKPGKALKPTCQKQSTTNELIKTAVLNIKPQIGEIAEAPPHKLNIANLSSRFEPKNSQSTHNANAQKISKNNCSGNGREKNELSAILSKRRAHVDS